MASHFYARTPLPELYRWFASEAAPSSPVWQRLCLWIAQEPSILDKLEGLDGEQRQPNRFLAALKYWEAPLEPGEQLLEWLDGRWDEVLELARTRTTQTNEPGRLGVLAPVFGALSQPVALLELGAAAGVCLLPDVLPMVEVTHEGMPPRMGAPLRVGARIGVDRNPLDARDADTVRWLRALVWPGEEDREARLAKALDVASRHPLDIRKADLTVDPSALIPALVDELRAEAPGATPVVFHSTTLGYLSRDRRQAVIDAIRATGAHWVSFEDARVVPGLQARAEEMGPRPDWGTFILALDGDPLAWCQPHGRRARWL